MESDLDLLSSSTTTSIYKNLISLSISQPAVNFKTLNVLQPIVVIAYEICKTTSVHQRQLVAINRIGSIQIMILKIPANKYHDARTNHFQQSAAVYISQQKIDRKHTPKKQSLLQCFILNSAGPVLPFFIHSEINNFSSNAHLKHFA